MAFGALSTRPAEKAHQPIPSIDRIDRRAGLIGLARPVHFAGCDAGNTDPWTFRAPDRPIAIPNCSRCASEGSAGRYDLARCGRGAGIDKRRQWRRRFCRQDVCENERKCEFCQEAHRLSQLARHGPLNAVAQSLDHVTVAANEGLSFRR